MNYYQAKTSLRNGRRLKRREWGNSYIVLVSHDIMMVEDDDRDNLFLWYPTDEDRDANDWEIVW